MDMAGQAAQCATPTCQLVQLVAPTRLVPGAALGRALVVLRCSRCSSGARMHQHAQQRGGVGEHNAVGGLCDVN